MKRVRGGRYSVAFTGQPERIVEKIMIACLYEVFDIDKATKATQASQGLLFNANSVLIDRLSSGTVSKAESHAW